MATKTGHRKMAGDFFITQEGRRRQKSFRVKEEELDGARSNKEDRAAHIRKPEIHCRQESAVYQCEPIAENKICSSKVSLAAMITQALEALNNKFFFYTLYKTTGTFYHQNFFSLTKKKNKRNLRIVHRKGGTRTTVLVARYTQHAQQSAPGGDNCGTHTTPQVNTLEYTSVNRVFQQISTRWVTTLRSEHIHGYVKGKFLKSPLSPMLWGM